MVIEHQQVDRHGQTADQRQAHVMEVAGTVKCEGGSLAVRSWKEGRQLLLKSAKPLEATRQANRRTPVPGSADAGLVPLHPSRLLCKASVKIEDAQLHRHWSSCPHGGRRS